MLTTLRIQAEDFDLAEQYSLLRSSSPATTEIGAIVTFTGLVREFEPRSTDHNDDGGALDGMRLQHYPGMTEKLLQGIIDDAAQRWPLLAVTVIHRVGHLAPCDQIVFVGVASEHRQPAFQAAEFIMDYLKTRATFWKQITIDGQPRWVDSKDSDTTAARRWDAQCDG